MPPTSLSPISITIPVAWGEMDALGHVNNVVFFRYFESARVQYLRQLGWRDGTEPTPALAAAAPGFILHSMNARFRRPVIFPDTLTITARCTSVSSDRLTIDHAAFSQSQSGALVAEGSGIVVCYDYSTRQKAPLPDALFALLTQAAAESPAASAPRSPAPTPPPRTTLPPS